MSWRDLRLTSLSDLGSASISNKRILAPAGTYGRRPPFFIDVECADLATHDTALSHFKVLTQQHGAIDMVALPQAIVVGQGAVITSEGELVRESVLEFVAHGKVPDGLEFSADRFGLPRPADRVIEEPCLLAKRPWFRNYGHFLVDAAALLALAKDVCERERLSVVIGACESDSMAKLMADTISQILPHTEILTHRDNEVWRFDELHYVRPVHVPPIIQASNSNQQSLRHLITRAATTAASKAVCFTQWFARPRPRPSE